MPTHKIVKSWTTEAGLPAVVLLVNDGSHHCGYVALPADLADKDFVGYGSGEYVDISVHGGVTYQDALPQLEGKIVIGFDCAHAGDKTKYSYIDDNDVWRDEQYCTDECESMAKQLMAMLPKQLEG